MISNQRIAVIGAGIGGLAAALRLSHMGAKVDVFDLHDGPGGKMRTLPSGAGPVDAGPTVLTLIHVFQSLYADVGEDLHAQLDLTPLHVLARHFWEDGTVLDLTIDPSENHDAIANIFGTAEADRFDKFDQRARRLFDAFDLPMMQKAAPDTFGMVKTVARQPALALDMAPHLSLASLLKGSFKSPHLQQLFGRYATYVGGSPLLSPALLSLIWSAEGRGVWTLKNGMNALAQNMMELAKVRGAQFHFRTPVKRIIQQNGRTTGVETEDGRIEADLVVFNGDPRALVQGALGPSAQNAIKSDAVEPRSLSAYVHAFSAAPSGIDLSHHNVFFSSVPNAEFGPLAHGQRPTDATLYLCAQDHGQVRADAEQRFEIIMNGPPVGTDPGKEKDTCQTQIFDRLRTFGLFFDRRPGPETLTTPAEFDQLFPQSLGSLYGRSPHGLTAGMKRPQAKTKLPGLYLCGGGAHPGAGIPMATLSAKHAVDAILSDLSSTSTSPQTAMPGGISTGSATAAPKPSLSSRS